MQLSSLAIQFILEGRDHCDMAASGLLNLEAHSHDPEIINGIFRSFHTLKGTSGIFPEYGAITSLTHAAEDLMDLIRNGQKSIDSEITDLFLAVLDQVGGWLDVLESTGAVPGDALVQSAPLIAALKAMKSGSDFGCILELEPTTEAAETNGLELVLREWLAGLNPSRYESLFSALQSPDATLTAFCYTPVPDAFFFGDDPVSLIRSMPGVLLLDVIKLSDAPFDADYDPFVCDLQFLAIVAADDVTVRDVFAYVEDQIALLPFAAELLENKPAPILMPDSADTPAFSLTEVEPEQVAATYTGTAQSHTSGDARLPDFGSANPKNDRTAAIIHSGLQRSINS